MQLKSRKPSWRFACSLEVFGETINLVCTHSKNNETTMIAGIIDITISDFCDSALIVDRILLVSWSQVVRESAQASSRMMMSPIVIVLMVADP